MGVAYTGVGNIGSVCPDAVFNICGSCEGRTVLWVRDVRYFTTHWEDLGRITPQGGPHNYGESAAEDTGWYVDETPAGGGEGGDVSA